jgi:RNA polymerase sigma-70 factor, ECF subfamily
MHASEEERRQVRFDVENTTEMETHEMLTATTAIDDSGVPSVVVAGAQKSVQEPSPERRQEFEDILSHAMPRFLSLAARWLGNREDAEDAVQDAMLSAFTHIAGFDGRSKMSTWITAIVINAVRMQVRRRIRRRMLSLDWVPPEGQSTISELLADPRPTPESTLERSELRNLVIRLTDSLPPSQRLAVRLHQRDDFSIRKAAATLGVPEGTLKARLARGRAKLAKQFEKTVTEPRTRSSRSGPKTKLRALTYRSGRIRLPQLTVAALAEQAERQDWVVA